MIADFESLFKKFKINDRDKNISYTEKCQDRIFCSFVYKVVYIDVKFSKPFIEEILEEYDYF